MIGWPSRIRRIAAGQSSWRVTKVKRKNFRKKKKFTRYLRTKSSMRGNSPSIWRYAAVNLANSFSQFFVYLKGEIFKQFRVCRSSFYSAGSTTSFIYAFSSACNVVIMEKTSAMLSYLNRSSYHNQSREILRNRYLSRSRGFFQSRTSFFCDWKNHD